ncbi:MAG: MarR family winged helix-turn-helix transcriptional regulator [Guyparkeria sp.]|uniref:MarR family winged helix-turn-helix transcriptional regulator n=1 Tax=Guyparkeria sp. TaxID=2035736 RepID=UPI00397861F7
MADQELAFDICAEDRVPVLLHRVDQLWRQLMDSELAHHGLSQAKWRTLAILSLYPDGLIQSELAEELGIEGPSLVAMIDRLSRDEWVERVQCGSDRRCKIIRLSDRALPLIDEIRESAEKLYGRTFAELDVPGVSIPDIERYFIALRDRLYENLPEKKRQQRRRNLARAAAED